MKSQADRKKVGILFMEKKTLIQESNKGGLG